MGKYPLMKFKASLRLKLLVFLLAFSLTTYTYTGIIVDHAFQRNLHMFDRHVLHSHDIPIDQSERPNKINNSYGVVNDSAKAINDHEYNGQIEKVLHIGFLKVHKAGSSSMQNIFFRFGLKHNLTFALPEKNNYIHRLDHILPVIPGGHFDILAVHTSYSKQLFDNLLPEDSVKIGIVREPLDRVISAAYYYRYKYHIPSLKAIPEKTFISYLINKPNLYDKATFSHTRNTMGRDFGFSPNITRSDVNKIQEHMNFLQKEIKLVLVMERFEESLILMRRYLHWEMSDILFVKINRNRHVNVDRRKLNMKTFRRTCFLDYVIYETFSGIFSKKVENEGSDFQKEVDHFKSALNEIHAFCFGLKKAPKWVIPVSKWNKKHEVIKEDCDMMRMDEIELITKLRLRHVNMNNQHAV